MTTPEGEEALLPDRVEGRCCFCPCGEGRMELPGPTKDDREKMTAGHRVYYTLMCPECVHPVRVEDPWRPR